MFKDWSLLGVFVLLLRETNWKCREDRGMPRFTKGGQIELRLDVTCRGEKRSAVEQPITKKSVYVGKEKDECKMTKILSDDASSR